VNTLCEAEVLPHQNCDDPASVYPEDGMKIKPVTVGTFAGRGVVFRHQLICRFTADLERDGARISLTIVDTPGFGDNINNESA